MLDDAHFVPSFLIAFRVFVFCYYTKLFFFAYPEWLRLYIVVNNDAHWFCFGENSMPSDYVFSHFHEVGKVVTFLFIGITTLLLAIGR